MDLNGYITRRAQNWDAMTKILDGAATSKRELSGEETQTYDRLEAEVNTDSKQIERLERHAKMATGFNAVDASPALTAAPTPAVDDESRYAQAFDKFFRFGLEELDNDQRRLVRSGFKADPEMRAQAVGTNTAGGFVVPQGYRNQIIETMKAFGNVAAVAEVLTTDTGAPLPWPTNDDTGNEGAILGENVQDTELDVVFGQNQLGAFKYTSRITRASVEFIQDTAVDAQGFITRKHGERLGRITNRHFTVGTGTAQPQGIVTGATVGVTAGTGGTSAITGDNLIDLQHSVDPAYRTTNARYMLTDTALASIRKLKDANGMYLWQPSVQAGVASSLLGYPYIINQHMAVPAASVRSVLFGDFRAGYVVRLVRDIQAVRFNERYMDFFQVGFVSFLRADGRVQDANAYKALAQSAT
ncbi:MAG: phage major capsid protein [Acidimicrobiales bacterium]